MKSQVLVLVFVILVASLIVGGSEPRVLLRAQPESDLCGCGPDTCLNDPRYPPKLARKKAEMKQNSFPDDLMALLDRDGKCVIAVEQAPDSFRILLVAKNSSDSNSIEWTQQDEDIATKQILNNEIKAYYKYNVRKVLSCCGEPKAG